MFVTFMIRSTVFIFPAFLVLASSGFAAPPPKAEEVVQNQEAQRGEAELWARKAGLPIRGNATFDKSGNLVPSWGLVGYDEKPIYYQSTNQNAAISSNIQLIRQTAPYSLDGEGLYLGIWDGGRILETHQEFTSRVITIDISPLDLHATHVAGTLAAKGVNPLAKGMAPEVQLIAGDFFNDFGEIVQHTVSGLDDMVTGTLKISVSNHSYGEAVGWTAGVNFSGTSGFHWLDFVTNLTDPDFGRYTAIAVDWDSLCYQYPYWLPVISAGNDRNDTAPAVGATFWHFDALGASWESAVYNPAIHAPADFSRGGYDTMIGSNGGKNVLTVGAVNDAVTAGTRDLAKATMSSFSGWGPMDDGRIKPDVVANGVGLLSTFSQANDRYGSISGTSMSSPTTAGAALLLQEWAIRLNNQMMTSAGLKALIIHTADDLGRVGPDYEFGWGLVNAFEAARYLEDAHAEWPILGEVAGIWRGELSSAQPLRDYVFVVSNSEPLKVTLCWTDPAGTEQIGLDNPTASLVNDLNLVGLVTPSGEELRPWVLDPANPTVPATTGINSRDNVEQIAWSPTSASQVVRLCVEHTGTLEGGIQEYVLLISGEFVSANSSDWEELEK